MANLTWTRTANTFEAGKYKIVQKSGKYRLDVDGQTVLRNRTLAACQAEAQKIEDQGGTNSPDAPSMRACLLIYDIPERVEFANPSGVLRRYAVRVNLSCWVVPENAIPYTLLNRMTEAGATWHVVKFDAAEAPKLVEMARVSLVKELRDQVERSRASARKAEARLDDEDHADRREWAVNRLEALADALEVRFKELQEDLEAAAARFGITREALGIDDCRRAIEGISGGMHARAKLFAEGAAAVRAAGMTDLANAADSGAVQDGAVLADAVDDAGGDGTALRAAFDHNAAARLATQQADAAVLTPPADGPVEFSLADDAAA